METTTTTTAVAAFVRPRAEVTSAVHGYVCTPVLVPVMTADKGTTVPFGGFDVAVPQLDAIVATPGPRSWSPPV